MYYVSYIILLECNQGSIPFLAIKSLTNSGRWLRREAAIERWPAENQGGGFFFSTTFTVFFANSSVGVDDFAAELCVKRALAWIASWNWWYNFHCDTPLLLQLAIAEFAMLDFTSPGTTFMTSIPNGRTSSLHTT